MEIDTSSFGRAIASARKAIGLSQKELAAKIIKEDGDAITPQYLNDIEHDRRSPSSDHIVNQFAKVLGITSDVLYWLARRVPSDIARSNVGPDKINAAFAAFRRSLKE